jgi:hypothetical protein
VVTEFQTIEAYCGFDVKMCSKSSIGYLKKKKYSMPF